MQQARSDKTSKLLSSSIQGIQTQQTPCSPKHNLDTYHLNQGGVIGFTCRWMQPLIYLTPKIMHKTLHFNKSAKGVNWISCGFNRLRRETPDKAPFQTCI